MDVKKIKFEWFGEIPEEWKVSKIKFMHTQNINSFKDGDWIESPDIIEEGIRYITTGNIGEGTFKYQGRGFISEETFERLNCTEIFEGDLIVSRLSPPVGRSCILPNLGNRVITSVDNVVIRLKEEYFKEFYNFLFNSVPYFQHTDTLSRGSTLTRISRNILGNIKILVPPLNEQKLISKFLIKKIEQIDSLIEKIGKKIELLKEQKTALINKYVTKGIDVNVDIKDSGVEWIGAIPKHWKLSKIKYLTSFNDEVLDDKTDPNYYFHYIEVGDVSFNKGILIKQKISYKNSPSRARRIVQPRDVIISTVRTYLKSISIVPKIPDLICSTGFCVLRCKNKNLLPEYLSYFVKTNGFIQEVVKNSYGVSYPAINSIELTQFYLLLPPLKEQEQIIRVISKQEDVITKIIQKNEKKAILLKEYRQSLISSVVTGKIRITEDMI